MIRHLVPAGLCLALLSTVPALSMTQTVIYAGQNIEAGQLTITNTPDELMLVVEGTNGWAFTEVHVYVGFDPPPVNGGGNPAPGKFPYKFKYPNPENDALIVLPIPDAGPSCEVTTLNVAVHLDMVNTDTNQQETGWAFGPNAFPKQWGWWLPYTVSCDDVPR